MYELFIFSEKLVENRSNLVVGNSFLIKVKKETNKDNIERINLENIFFIDDLKNEIIDQVSFKINNIKSLDVIKNRLNERGSSNVNIIYMDKNSKEYSFKLQHKLNVRASDIEFLENYQIKPIF